MQALLRKQKIWILIEEGKLKLGVGGTAKIDCVENNCNNDIIWLNSACKPFLKYNL